MVNQAFYTEENINKNKAVWNILIENGLANTIYELRTSTQYDVNVPGSAKQRTWELYQFRGKRWEDQEVDSDVECPSFSIKQSNLLTAIKQSLKDIDSFLLTSNCGWTKYIESELLIKISNDLKEDGLIPLLIHDAFLVPESYSKKYEVLSNKYILEIINDYKSSLLTDEVAIQIDKEFIDLLKSKALIRFFVSRFKTNTKYS